MVSTFIVYLACIKGICHQAYLILIKNLESCWSHDKCWKILIDLGCIFFVVWIFSLVCLRFVVVWWNVCSALSLDKWWSLGVNSRVSQLQGIPAVFWDSICVYIYFFLLYFLWFFFSHFFLRLNHLRALIWLQTFQILPIIYPLLSTHKKNDEGTATSDKWNTEIYIQM